MERELTELEQEVFIWLNIVRESGAINMYGASTHIQEHFDLDRKTASNILLLWMGNFRKDGDYTLIKE